MTAMLIQFAGSAVGVALMVGLAWLATRGRGTPPLDEATARRWLADEFPDRPIERLWLASDGLGALAKAGVRAFVLTRVGDSYAAREIDWARAAAAEPKDGRVRITLSDVTAPTAVLAFSSWPPTDLAA